MRKRGEGRGGDVSACCFATATIPTDLGVKDGAELKTKSKFLTETAMRSDETVGDAVVTFPSLSHLELRQF